MEEIKVRTKRELLDSDVQRLFNRMGKGECKEAGAIRVGNQMLVAEVCKVDDDTAELKWKPR